MSMDIFNNKIGDKVICMDDGENNWGNCDQVKGNLIVGEIYTIEDIEIHSWHTKIRFKEVPGKVFNSIHFEDIEGEAVTSE